jgi:hypothetical protein
MAWKNFMKSKNKKRNLENEVKERNRNLEENLHNMKEEEGYG